MKMAPTLELTLRVGEKFLVWSDQSPSIETILGDVTLYWLTNTISTSLYHYRSTAGRYASTSFKMPDLNANKKPVGYSLFAKEIQPIPKVAAEKLCNLVWFRRHDKGGHFAALEQPEVFWEDLKDFANKVW